MTVHAFLVLVPRLIIWSSLLILLTRTVADPDLFGHVRFGLDMLREGRIPTVDPYSFASDRDWVNHEWLSELSMATAYQASGTVGLALFKCLVLLSACAVLVWELAQRRCSRIVQDLALVLVVIGAASFTPTIRPQLFSFICFTLLLVCLRHAEDGSSRAFIPVPVLFALWANLHGGWLVGLGVLESWVAVRLVWPAGPARSRWLAVGLAGLAGTLATPYGASLWAFMWETVGIGRVDISEWQPLHRFAGIDQLPWLITTVVAVLALRRRPPISHAVVTLMLMALSFLVLRVGTFFTLATALLLVPRLAAGGMPRETPQTNPANRLELAMLLLVSVTAMAASAVMSVRHLSCISMQAAWAPDSAVMQVLRSEGSQGRLLTWFDWGEYAIWHLSPGIKVSYDGRRETVYSQDVIDRHLIFYAGRDPGWQEALRRIRPDYIWLPVGLPVLDKLQRPEWHEMTRTPRSVLLSRAPAAEVPVTTLNGASCFPGG